MRIKLDDTHYLISETECCWVVAMSKSKNGKMYERRVSGYYRDVEQTLKSYFDKHVNSNETSSIRALRNDIRETKEAIHNWIEELKGVDND